MLEPTLRALTTGRVILASGSPRRQEVVNNLGIKAEIIPSTYDEALDRCLFDNHGDYVAELAKNKVYEVFERVKNDTIAPTLIIGADTLVTLGETIFGKPKDKNDAIEMLSSLANREHYVYTGVCLKTLQKEINFYEKTKVKFGDITKDQIHAYVNTGEPLDKAGGYGVQGKGGCLIERVEGDFYTVVGLPLYSITKYLNDLFSST